MSSGNVNKFYFESNQALVFKLARSTGLKICAGARSAGLVFFFLAFLFGFLSFASEQLDWIYGEQAIGAAFILLGLFWLSWLLHLFYKNKIILFRPKLELKTLLSQGGNLAECFDFRLAKILIKESRGKKDIKPLMMAHWLVKRWAGSTFVLTRMGVGQLSLEKRIQAELDRQVWSDEKIDSIDIFLAAANRALARKSEVIKNSDLFWALFRFDPFLNELLVEQEMTIDDVNNVVEWYERLRRDSVQAQRFWDYHNLMRRGGIARHWAAAYTLTIDQYSRDLTEIARNRDSHPEFFGHKAELEQVENVLAGSGHNNVLLVGQPGSGRMEVVRSLAAKSFWGTSLPVLNGKRFMELDLLSLIAQTPSMDEAIRVLDNCFREASSMSNVILVIRSLENFLSQTNVASLDLSNLLAKYLESAHFQIIATASYEGLHRQLQQRPGLLNLFNKIEVSPPSAHQTLLILEYLTPEFEQRYDKFIPYLALKKTVERSARYLQNKPFPQKAIDLLDEVLVFASRQKSNYVDPDWVDQIISRLADVPIGRVQSSEKQMLLNLEKLIHQRVINQEEAVREVSASLRRARAEIITRRDRPMGAFLFLGPTGVGKTETAKALADIYFGSVDKMIRIDMSEFQETKDIYRLIGDPDHVGLLTSQVRENPFSLILLDEVEKAHPDILNLFLTVFDEGYITDGFGQKVVFADTIIVATSNAGAEVIRQDIEADMSLNMIKEDLLDYLMKHKYFRPELINRFTAVVIFKTLTPEHLLDISELILGRLANSLAEQGIEFQINHPLKEKIVELSYRPAFGAREMERVVHDKVANVLAEALLSDYIKRGDRVTIDPTDFSVKLIDHG